VWKSDKVVRTQSRETKGRRSYHQWLEAREMVAQMLLGLEGYEVGEVGLRQRKDCPVHIVFLPDAFDAYGSIL